MSRVRKVKCEGCPARNNRIRVVTFAGKPTRVALLCLECVKAARRLGYLTEDAELNQGILRKKGVN